MSYELLVAFRFFGSGVAMAFEMPGRKLLATLSDTTPAPWHLGHT